MEKNLNKNLKENLKENLEKDPNEDLTDNLIDDFTDMPDMEDDEKFRQWLEEEYIREGEKIEKALLAGREYEDNLAKADEMRISRECFYERLKEEGLLEEETEKEAEKAPAKEPAKESAQEASEENTSAKVIFMEEAAKKNTSGKYRKIGYHRLGKVAGVAGVCLLCVFAASMSSEANRKYLVNSVRILSGNDSKMVVFNDGTNEDANTDESRAIEDIEDTLGIEMPEFYYRPYEMQFKQYTIDSEAFVARIEYIYQNSIIMFYIDKENENTASNINSLHGEKKEIITTSGDNIPISIEEIQDPEEKNYRATWSLKDVSYTISGRIELEELKKILEQMKF